MKKLLIISLRITLPVGFALVIVTVIYGKGICWSRFLRFLVEHFIPFVYSSSTIVPAVVMSYSISKRISFGSSKIVEATARIITSFPVFIIAVFLQGIFWIRIFHTTSYHNIVKDYVSSFVPTFTTLLIVVTFHIFSQMKPIVDKIVSSEFVRTMKSIGESQKEIIRKLFRNVDIEFSRSLTYLIPMFLGESIVIERIYNFRGVGYELVESMRNLNIDSLSALSVYFFLILMMTYIFSWMVGERWAERLYS